MVEDKPQDRCGGSEGHGGSCRSGVDVLSSR